MHGENKNNESADVRVGLHNSPTLCRPVAASGGVLLRASVFVFVCLRGGVWVTWGHVVFERGTTQTRPR